MAFVYGLVFCLALFSLTVSESFLYSIFRFLTFLHSIAMIFILSCLLLDVVISYVAVAILVLKTIWKGLLVFNFQLNHGNW